MNIIQQRLTFSIHFRDMEWAINYIFLKNSEEVNYAAGNAKKSTKLLKKIKFIVKFYWEVSQKILFFFIEIWSFAFCFRSFRVFNLTTSFLTCFGPFSKQFAKLRKEFIASFEMCTRKGEKQLIKTTFGVTELWVINLCFICIFQFKDLELIFVFLTLSFILRKPKLFARNRIRNITKRAHKVICNVNIFWSTSTKWVFG